MKKTKFDPLVFWIRCLDKIGMTDPWAQYAFTGILKLVLFLLGIGFVVYIAFQLGKITLS